MLVAPGVAAHDPADAQPVMIGLDGPNLDACGGYGEVDPLDPDGDNFLAVRAAPTTRSSIMDRIHTGQGLLFCDVDGDWVGVVYRGEGQDDWDCGTNINLPEPREYHGPCRHGWVHGDYVTLLIG
ncbi:hypothetical protein AAW01_02605 [Aurantiacibacter gangjinensis]|uniref:Integron n=2 Tax=Aurantiacibacter gangjinensis TaxID=502682 RepID=A0A0G9MQB5_9SPHN|nr:hypothetical protein AAW01_02605 [Aurantiacibacter gangjinensis]